jgi:hypothetical protein
MNGYDHNSDYTKWWPKVVEGCSPVYGEDGSIYLMYTGSGYWTTWYALGYMKLVGTDPMNPASWQKRPRRNWKNPSRRKRYDQAYCSV